MKAVSEDKYLSSFTRGESVSTTQSPEDKSISDYLREKRIEDKKAADNAAVRVIADVGDEIDIDGLLVKVTYAKFYDNVYEIQADGIPYVDDYIQRAINRRKKEIEKGWNDLAFYYDEESGRYINSRGKYYPQILVIQYEYHETRKYSYEFDIFPNLAVVRDSLDYTDLHMFDGQCIYADEFEFDRTDADAYLLSIAEKSEDKCLHLTSFVVVNRDAPTDPDVVKLYLDFSANYPGYYSKKVNERATYRCKIYERE
ncbi:MAG: hypothetical protein K6F17_04990 [Lachnospiraceae bacterium]|nr:hypothetical protein [Lachnospiraceae bacterium]